MLSMTSYTDRAGRNDAMARSKMNEETKNLFLARALYDAVEDCNVQQVSLLLSQNKANPNILIPEEGMTSFHLAAGHDNIAFGKVVTSLILHNGGDPNVRCEGNRTVLHISVAWNRSSVVEILLKSPYIVPDPYLKDDDGLNVFNYAVKYSAWESLATLQLYIKQNKNPCDSSKKVPSLKKLESNKQDNCIENNALKEVIINDKSIGIESECNESNNIHTNIGYFNSNESLNCDFDSQTNNTDNEFLNTANSISNILNNNIVTDPGDLSDVSAHVHFDESNLSSINDFEDLETISFPSENLLVDTELFDDKVKLTTKNTYSQTENDLCAMYSEWMTDISGLSSCVGSDDYHTCPDGNSSYVLNGKMNKTDTQYGNKVLAKMNSPLSDLVSELPKNLKVLEISEEHLNSSEGESSLSDIIEDYDTDFVRQSLRKYGCHPGPLVPSTKQLYVKKLNRIVRDESELKNSNATTKITTGSLYSCQLTKTLFENAFDAWKETLKSWSYLEKDIICYKSGSSFTYLLLDPRITKNLPVRAEHMANPVEIWQTFINSIFYIGKGTKSRPNDHMNEAFNCWIGTNTKNLSPKTEYILSLWKENTGVVCVQAFHHLTTNEAHIREAAMIDAIGLDKLTNEKRGTYYDKTLRWRHSDRCKLGCYLLSRAMNVFLADGERQLQPVHLT